jgi:hypothetical protein
MSTRRFRVLCALFGRTYIIFALRASLLPGAYWQLNKKQRGLPRIVLTPITNIILLWCWVILRHPGLKSSTRRAFERSQKSSTVWQAHRSKLIMAFYLFQSHCQSCGFVTPVFDTPVIDWGQRSFSRKWRQNLSCSSIEISVMVDRANNLQHKS